MTELQLLKVKLPGKPTCIAFPLVEVSLWEGTVLTWQDWSPSSTELLVRVFFEQWRMSYLLQLLLRGPFVAPNSFRALMASSFHDKLLVNDRLVTALLQLVARSEWFILNPVMSAFLHRRATVFPRVWWPSGRMEYKQSVVVILSGCK